MSTTKSARLSLLEHTGIKFRVANSRGTKIRYTVFGHSVSLKDILKPKRGWLGLFWLISKW